MKISAKEEYGMRCLLQLAKEGEDRSLSISQIAEREGLSVQNTAKIMHLLKKNGFIKSVRGLHGGFLIAKPARDITVWEVMERLSSGPYDDTFCQTHTGEKTVCVHQGNCGIRPVWAMIVSHLKGALSRMSIAELVADEPRAQRSAQIHFNEENGKGATSKIHVATARR